MNIVFASDSEYEYIKERDHHILENLIIPKIRQNEIFIIKNDDHGIIGWMRHSYFWDNTPFMNMIWIDGPFRNNGIGKRQFSLGVRDEEKRVQISDDFHFGE